MDPSKRINKNPHVTPACHGCVFENQDDPTERSCYQCIRKEEEYWEGEKRGYKDYYQRRNE